MDNEESSVILSTSQDISTFTSEEALKQHCANHLAMGRLALVLGAGVSMACDLPDWNTLTNEVFRINGHTRPESLNDEEAAEYLLTECCESNEMEFASTVRQALYQGYSLSADDLRKKDLLMAIGALAMSSRRGNTANVITFNFDDLLETYLRYLGFSMQSVNKVPAWDNRADVLVLHPHGLLPSDMTTEVDHGIVLAQAQYDTIIGKDSNIWRQILMNIMRSNLCLFIGLSGKDNNLKQIMTDVHETHVCNTEEARWWGIRFSDNPDDPLKPSWEHRGVFQHSLNNYDELPSFLFEVCQLASQISQPPD